MVFATRCSVLNPHINLIRKKIFTVDKFIWKEFTHYIHVVRLSGHHAAHDVQN